MIIEKKKFHLRFEPATSGTPGEALNTAPQMHTCVYGKWSSQQHVFINIFNSEVSIENPAGSIFYTIIVLHAHIIIMVSSVPWSPNNLPFFST